MRLLIIVAALLLPGLVNAQETPNIEIPVPGLELTPIIRDNETITVPWLAQYIGGVYTFLISIVGLVAAVVMIVGGFQYVTSAGDKSRVGAAKERIVNAFIGMLLAFGSYAILFAINPDLVSFEGLKVSFVQPDIFERSLATTTVNTGEESSPVAAGTHVPKVGACPFTLTEKQGTRAGRLEFYAKVQSPGVITATTPAAKVVQIAEIADVCDVHLGSCGRTAGAINALAGVGKSAECLLEKYPGSDDRNNCNDGSKGRQLFAISKTQRLFMYALRCDTNGSSDWPQCSFEGPWTQANAKCTRRDCVNSGAAARQAFIDFMVGEVRAGRLASDWPHNWADQLQPGDRLVIYNGNPDLVGAHAIIFMGWAADGVSAQVVQGSYGQPTKGGTWCIRDIAKCGKRFVPLTNGWRP